MTPAVPDPGFSLEARGLSAVLGGRKVLDIPSLSIVPGGVLVIVGPNGSGKTTLLLSLSLLLKPAAGDIFYMGNRVSYGAEALKLRRRFAVLFQEPLLLSGTVWDNVTLGLRLRHTPKKETKTRAVKWLERFGITHLASRQARSLSGGEAKRVSLARAFVLEPEVLFLDEPFAALDTPTHQSLLEDFQTVLHETKISTVMVTHELEEALILGDRAAVLIKGVIRQTGTPREVISAPVDEEVAAFVKGGNILHGSVIPRDDGRIFIKVGNRQIEAAPGPVTAGELAVFLHYDDITISEGQTTESSNGRGNRFDGIITQLLPLNSQVRLNVACPFNLTAVVTRRTCEELHLEKGKEVIASFEPAAVRVFKQGIPIR